MPSLSACELRAGGNSVTIRTPVPCGRFPAQFTKRCHSVPSQALTAVQADLAFRLIQQTAVLRRVVLCKLFQQQAADFRDLAGFGLQSLCVTACPRIRAAIHTFVLPSAAELAASGPVHWAFIQNGRVEGFQGRACSDCLNANRSAHWINYILIVRILPTLSTLGDLRTVI
jgi:hypothetical protein